jgi:hypothetical protein
MTQKLQRLPIFLLYILKEMGWAESQDAQPHTVGVPTYCPEELLSPVDRMRRRTTIVHCIFAGGSEAIP